MTADVLCVTGVTGGGLYGDGRWMGPIRGTMARDAQETLVSLSAVASKCQRRRKQYGLLSGMMQRETFPGHSLGLIYKRSACWIPDGLQLDIGR